MRTYKELQEQIAELQKQAENARKQEVAAVVVEVKAKIAEFGISAEDLGYATKGKGRGKPSTAAAKYRDPVSGKQWNGKGRKPGWLADALASGRSTSEFLI